MCLQWYACACSLSIVCSLTPSVRVLSVAPASLKACVYNSFLSSKASSFDHTWFPSGCNEPQHLKEENRTIKKGPWQVEAQNVSLKEKEIGNVYVCQLCLFTFTIMSFGSVQAGAYNGLTTSVSVCSQKRGAAPRVEDVL